MVLLRTYVALPQTYNKVCLESIENGSGGRQSRGIGWLETGGRKRGRTQLRLTEPDKARLRFNLA